MLAIADDITVIRRGTTVATVKPADVTSHELAELMVGSELPSPSTEESTVTDRCCCSTCATSSSHDAVGRAELADINFDIHAGEVLGIAGVEGNGQTELVETARRHAARRSTGIVRWATTDISHWSTRDRREVGHRLHPRGPATARAAARLTAVGEPHPRPPDPPAERCKGAWLNVGVRARTPSASSTQYDVRTPGIDTTARALSGGNQQKFIVGREMSGDPVLLIASHPTRGVDVGAQAADLGPHPARPAAKAWRCC